MFMDEKLDRAHDITRRFAKVSWGEIAPLSTREAHAVMSALRMSAIMPDGDMRCIEAQTFLLTHTGRELPLNENNTNEVNEQIIRYCRQFLQLVAGFMGWYEHGE